MRSELWLTALLCSGLLLSRAAAQAPAPSPVDFPSPSLGRLVQAAERITIFQVSQVDPIARTITWNKISDLKGHEPATTVIHQFDDDMPAAMQRHVFGWAARGKRAIAVIGVDKNCGMCLGNSWYLGELLTSSWKISGRHWETWDLSSCYVGPIDKLAEQLKAILAGEEVVVTVAAPAPPGFFADEPTPLVRDALHGKKGRVCRVRASLKLVDEKSIAACPGGYFVGWGVGGVEVVPGLVAALASKDARRRAEAAEDLGQIGAAARAAVPALRAALRDEDGIVGVFAAEALARIDPGNKDAIAALIEALKDRREGVGTAAATALLALGAEGRRGIEPLTTVLEKADDATVRGAIAFVLSRLAPEAEVGVRRKVVAALGRVLRRDRDAEVRTWAARALLKFGPDCPAVLSDLRAALNDESEEVAAAAVNVLSRQGHAGAVLLAEAFADRRCENRSRIADVLRNLGPGTPHVVPALKKALDDEDPAIRMSAIQVLLRIDRPTGLRLGVPILARLLADDRTDIRLSACLVLAGVGSDAEAAVPALIDLLKSKMERRYLAAYALGSIGPAARAAIPFLIENLESDDDNTAYCAAEALAQLGPGARRLAGAAEGITHCKEDTERVRLAATLGRLGDTREAVTVLEEIAISKEDPRATQRALEALGEMGPKAAAALPGLRKALRDKKDHLRPRLAVTVCRIGRRIERGYLVLDERHEGFEALADLSRQGDWNIFLLFGMVEELGADAASLVPVLVAGLRDNRPDGDRRWGCIYVLGKIGPAAVQTAPVLEALLKDTHDPDERIQIAETLVRLGRPRLAASVLPLLRDRLRTRSGRSANSLERDPFELLGLLGPEAKAAVPDLLQVMRHDDYNRYRQAAAALVAIDPQAAAKAGVYDPPLR